MDTFRDQTLDAQKAKEIIFNTRDRMSRINKKTDEEYVRILIDEVNQYFNSLDNTILNTNDLPTEKDGPRSEQHNNLLNNSVDDIDRIHAKQRVAEGLLTRSVNYMSSERDSITTTASKLQARLINHKLRSSSNDRNVIVFTEYFNDEGLTDRIASQDYKIDPSRSALSLRPIVEEKDNSSMIDPDSVSVSLEFDEKVNIEDGLPLAFNSVYPFAHQGDELNMAYGQSLSKAGVTSKESNLTNSTVDERVRRLKLQKQSLKAGFAIGESVEEEISDDTHCEFEIVWSDFRDLKAVNAIKEAIGDAGFDDPSLSINESQLLMDFGGGKSFSGANNNDGSDSVYSDEDIPMKKIKGLTLNFSLKEGVTIPGNLAKVNIQFIKPLIGGFIPRIDYKKSKIITAQGEVLRPFVNPPDSVENKIEEARSLMISTTVTNPRQFKIALKLDGDASQYVDEIKEYVGAYWKFMTEGATAVGVAIPQDTTISWGDRFVKTSTGTTFYIYHDLVRDENSKDLNEKNIDIANDVVSVTKLPDRA